MKGRVAFWFRIRRQGDQIVCEALFKLFGQQCNFCNQRDSSSEVIVWWILFIRNFSLIFKLLLFFVVPDPALVSRPDWECYWLPCKPSRHVILRKRKKLAGWLHPQWLSPSQPTEKKLINGSSRFYSMPSMQRRVVCCFRFLCLIIELYIIFLPSNFYCKIFTK